MSYELWVWLVKEEDGTEGAIATVIPGFEPLGIMVLQNRKKAVAESMAAIAQAHGLKTGLPVRLAYLRELNS